jgi:hypothetical protein
VTAKGKIRKKLGGASRKKAAREYPQIAASELNTIAPELDVAAGESRSQQYAQKLSNALALKIANALRHAFPNILPDETGTGQESLARTTKGYKRLDVNYSTVQLGLALGVSIKTTNAPEGTRGNYAKNVTGRDAELRAEAEDYHERQPYSVLIALYFVPAESCENATKKAPSSFGSIAKTLRYRCGRKGPKDLTTLFESGYVGLYEQKGPNRGAVEFFDVANDPPFSGRPAGTLTFAQVIEEIKRIYDERNQRFSFADAIVEPFTIAGVEEGADVEEPAENVEDKPNARRPR